MIDAWRRGDPVRLAATLNKSMEEDKGLEQLLLFDRNHRWADWIKARLDKPGTVFLAVGAGHLAGKGMRAGRAQGAPYQDQAGQAALSIGAGPGASGGGLGRAGPSHCRPRPARSAVRRSPGAACAIGHGAPGALAHLAGRSPCLAVRHHPCRAGGNALALAGHRDRPRRKATCLCWKRPGWTPSGAKDRSSAALGRSPGLPPVADAPGRRRPSAPCRAGASVAGLSARSRRL